MPFCVSCDTLTITGNWVALNESGKNNVWFCDDCHFDHQINHRKNENKSKKKLSLRERKLAGRVKRLENKTGKLEKAVINNDTNLQEFSKIAEGAKKTAENNKEIIEKTNGNLNEVKEDVDKIKEIVIKPVEPEPIKEYFNLTNFAGWWMFASIFLITVLWFWDNLVRFWNRPLEGELEGD